MLDINAHVNHLRECSREDWAVALELCGAGRVRHGLFFAHLSLEKLLKALVCRKTNDLAPRIHNLVRLAQLAGLAPPSEILDVLADMNRFNLEGRYPDYGGAIPDADELRVIIRRMEEAAAWLTAMFQ